MATCPTCQTHYPDGVATCVHDGAHLLPHAALASADPELAPGTRVGEYNIEGKLGEGGFGTVYRAVHPVIGKAAAIKVLSRQYSSNPQFVSRFVSEARAVNQIRHRNIIDIFSFGALDDGRQYYVMELLEGLPLDAYLRTRGRLPPSEALPVLMKIARALDAAHGAGIAHRDLKPENVFLVFDDDNTFFPKLLDFGIAKLLGESSGSPAHKTRTGLAMGTPLYMSPEQCRGKNIDHRTDIYSFGILAHELLTGQPPFDADEPLALLFKHTSEPAPPLSSVVADLSPALDAPLLRMLEKDPAQRPSSLLDAMTALVEAARGAGYEVPATAHRASDATPGGVRIVVGDATPGGARIVAGDASDSAKTEALPQMQVAPLAQAQTGSRQTQSALHTSGPAAHGSKPAPPPRRTLLLVAAALFGGAGVAAVALGLRLGGTPSQASSTPAPPAPPANAAARVEPPPAAPAPTPAVAPAASAVEEAREVELAFQATPKDVEIWRDGKLVGKAPGPLRVPRGEAAKLTFKAPGYQDQTEEVTAETDRAVTVTLKRAAPARAAGGSARGDLENPFQ
jgi:eukaryotic-like serine/threonine-protein kinase